MFFYTVCGLFNLLIPSILAFQTFFCKSRQLSDNSDCKWKKPNIGWTKANIDTYVFESKEAVGAVFRDGGTYLLVAIVKIFKDISNPMLLEMLAIQESLS